MSRFVDWLYAANPLPPRFIRLTGAILLYTWWIQLIKLPPRPYHVPSWRIGELSFSLPHFPLTVEFTLWGIFYLGAILMTCGVRKKWFLTIMAALFIFFGSREVQIFHMNYQFLLSTFFIAFLFNKDDTPSCARRLIQLSIASCYFYGAFGKLHPEWLNGETLNALLYSGWDLREIWQPLIKQIPLPISFLAPMSYLMFIVEMYLAFAFFFKTTRKSALIIGILLHAAFAIFIQQVEGYSAIMLLGYTAFYDQKSTTAEQIAVEPKQAKNGRQIMERSFATICALALVLMPARYLLFPKYPFSDETLFDHSPWGFGMYLFQQSVSDVKIQIAMQDGRSMQIEPTERMNECSSDSEFLTLARYLFEKYPEAEQIKISSTITINKKRSLEKAGIFVRNKQSQISVQHK